MLERKAVSYRVIIALLLIVFVSPVYGKKGETIGQFLKRVGRRKAKQVKFSKQKKALPTFKSFSGNKSVNLGKVRPPSSRRLYIQQNRQEIELSDVTDDGIKQLYKLSRKYRKSPRRKEIWLRLAELYVEKARYIEYKLQTKYDDDLAKYHAKKRKTKPRLNLKSSQEYNKKAIQLYEWFIRDFPNDKKAPQAYFFLGYNYFELNQLKKGEKYYKLLTQKFPKSEYVEESYYALGDYYFENGKWSDALASYKNILKNRRSRVYTLALYKSAWCNYNLDKGPQALKSLERVIYLGRSANSKRDSSSIQLAKEALRDLVPFYAEYGASKNATNYFEKKAGYKTAFKLLEKLAFTYKTMGKNASARRVFQYLIDRDPTNEKAFDFQYQIVTLYSSTGKGTVFKSEFYKWFEDYGKGSLWYEKNKKNKALIKKSTSLMESSLRNYTLQLHQTAQNSRAKFSQKLANDAYELYFNSFKKEQSKNFDEMKFFYGELLFDRGEYVKAANQYSFIVNNFPKSTYFKNANYNSVLSLEKKLPNEKEMKAYVGGVKEKVEFPKNVSNFIMAAESFLKNDKDSKERAAIEYKVASLYYHYNDYPKALDGFKTVIKKYPKTKYAEYSANLMLDIYNINKDYAGLEKAADELLSSSTVTQGDLSKQIKDIKQQTAFKKAENLEKQGDFNKSAQAYESFFKKYSTSKLAVPAAFNAAVNYEKGDNLLDALRMYQIVKLRGKATGDKKLSNDANRLLAVAYQNMGRYKKAADEFEYYVNENPKDANTMKFLYNAAIIRDNMRYYTKALQMYDRYYKESRDKNKYETLYLQGRIWEKRKKSHKSIPFYEKYINSPSSNKKNQIRAAYKIAKIYERFNNRSQTDKWRKKTINIHRAFSKRGINSGNTYAAEFMFDNVYDLFKKYKQIRIPANPKRQSAVIQQKIGKLNEIKNKLKAVIKLNDPDYVVASLALQGQALQHMASSIYSVPLPRGLNAEQLSQYKAGIDKIASPFKQQSIESYSAAKDKSRELSGYGEWAIIADNELSSLSDGARVFEMSVSRYAVYDKGNVDFNFNLDEESFLNKVGKDLQKNPKNVAVLNALGVYYIKNKKYDYARIPLERALSFQTHGVVLNNLGVIEHYVGERKTAYRYFRQSLDSEEPSKASSANLLSTYAFYRDFEKGVAAGDEAESFIKGNYSEGDAFLEAGNSFGVSLAQSGDHKKAESVFEKVLKSSRRHTNVMLNLAILKLKYLNKKEDGLKLLSKLKFVSDNTKIVKKAEELERKYDK